MITWVSPLFKVITALALLSQANCATTNGTPKFEDMLTKAGFRLKQADTPAKEAHLLDLPPKTIVQVKQQGRSFYAFADPDNKVLYVGNDAAYQRFLIMRSHQLAPGGGGSSVSRLGQMESDFEYSMEWDQWEPMDSFW
jgi:hypothetical protein